ncbi:hypothetical protein [Sorangium sp. So ce1078]|uniref:hypothetical protein n=1 Tax=Sorangium sp. So ce1078 TaxID=3133329 RepID=UPI003F63992A
MSLRTVVHVSTRCPRQLQLARGRLDDDVRLAPAKEVPDGEQQGEVVARARRTIEVSERREVARRLLDDGQALVILDDEIELAIADHRR